MELKFKLDKILEHGDKDYITYEECKKVIKENNLSCEEYIERIEYVLKRLGL